MIHHTRMKTFAVDAAAGNVAVVEALAKDGQKKCVQGNASVSL